MKYLSRFAVLAAFLTCVVVSFGCKAEPTYHPEQTFESEKWTKMTQLHPQNEEEIKEVQLIKYYKTEKDRRNNNGRELGFLTQIRLVVPYKKWDESYSIPDTEGTFNLHNEDAYLHTRLENGVVVKYEAVDKYIWEITTIEGVPVGMINEYGSIYKWQQGRNTMVYVGIGTIRSAITKIFDIKWNIYMQENEDNTYSVRGVDKEDQPVVSLSVMNDKQLQARFYRTASEITRSSYVKVLLEEYKMEEELEGYIDKKKSEDEDYLNEGDDDDDDDDDDDWGSDYDDDDDDDWEEN